MRTHFQYMSRFSFVILFSILFSNINAQQWVQTKGPGGGKAVSFIEKNGSILVATLGGIFKSTDNGDTWTRSMSGIPDEVFISTFAATGNYIYGGSNASGLYRSSDNGDSWSHIDIQVSNLFISKLFASHDTLYIGCDGCGAYRSADEAITFQPINNGFPSGAYVYSFAQTGGYLFAGLRGNGGTVGVYRAPVNSVNWVQVNNGLINSPSIIDMAVKGNDLLVTTQSFNGSGLYRSSDLGNNWFSQTPALPGGEFPTYLAVTENDIYFGTQGDAPYRSADNGITWQRVNNGLKPLTVYAFLPGSAGMFIGYERGISRTTDNAQSWERKVSGLTNTSITSLFTDGNTLFAAGRTMNIGSNDGVFFSTDAGQSWIPVDQGLLPDPEVNAITKSGDNIITGTGNFGLYVKTPLDAGFRRAAGIPNNIAVTALLSSGQYVLAGIQGGDELYRSSDHGLTWSVSNNGFGIQTDQVYSLYEKAGTIYAGGFNALYKSTDFGLNWSWAGNGIYPGSTVTGITSLGNELFACTRDNNGIYKSSNDGASWSPVNNGIPPIIHFNTIIAGGGSLFAGSDLGVYKSDDGGNSWDTINNGLLSNKNSLSLAVLNNKLFLGTDETAVWGTDIFGVLPVSLQSFSAKENNGIVNLQWQAPGIFSDFEVQKSKDGQHFIPIGNIHAGAIITQTYDLDDLYPDNGPNYYRIAMTGIDGNKKYSNVILINIRPSGRINIVITPNPASVQSVISISGNIKGKASIIAYDAGGRLVSTLYSGEINTNNFSSTLNISGLGKGIYILRITINGESRTEKFIVQ